MSKQCLSYLPCKVLRLPFHHRLLLLDQTMYVASLLEGVSDAATRGQQCMQMRFPPGRSPWILPLACRPSSKDMPGTRDRADLSRGHRTRPLSQLTVPERSSVCVSTCHKFVEKSLIAVQTQPRLASKIPLWLHLWRGRNVTGPRFRAACARRSAMAKGTSSSSVPCPMKIGHLTW